MLLSKNTNLLLSLILILLISNISCANTTEIIEPKCNRYSIQYSIIANMSEFLEEEKNIDGLEKYKNPVEDLKTKKMGTLKDLYFNRSKFDNIQDND